MELSSIRWCTELSTNKALQAIALLLLTRPAAELEEANKGAGPAKFSSTQVRYEKTTRLGGLLMV